VFLFLYHPRVDFNVQKRPHVLMTFLTFSMSRVGACSPEDLRHLARFDLRRAPFQHRERKTEHLDQIVEHKVHGRQGVNKSGSCHKPSDKHSSKDGAYGKSRTTLRHRLETKFPDPAFNMQGTASKMWLLPWGKSPQNFLPNNNTPSSLRTKLD